jgi:hypothetical protein
MERLIELVPAYLNGEQRFKILQTIAAHTRSYPKRIVVEVKSDNPDEGLSQIDRALASIQVTDELANIPQKVLDAATWLYDDDSTVARRLLVDIAKIETEKLKESAEKEIALLKRAILSGQIKVANYEVKTPGGILEIRVFPSKKASSAGGIDCFMATACFGRYDHRTDTFRMWRDSSLQHYSLGRTFISWYYANGKLLCGIIEKRPFLLRCTRVTLTLAAFLIDKLYGFEQKRRPAHGRR